LNIYLSGSYENNGCLGRLGSTTAISALEKKKKKEKKKKEEKKNRNKKKQKEKKK